MNIIKENKIDTIRGGYGSSQHAGRASTVRTWPGTSPLKARPVGLPRSRNIILGPFQHEPAYIALRPARGRMSLFFNYQKTKKTT